MDDSPNSNAALLRTIAHLQHERDELQRDIEQMCMHQSGATGSLDIIARLQARRTGILEQELEACRKDLAARTRENHKLQEELSEVYRIKGQFADLLKVEAEKSSELEKELKFFQSRVAVSLAERDRAIMEGEKTQQQKQEMVQKLYQLNARLDEITSEYSDKKNHCILLQEQLERTKAELEICQKVVRKFWQRRASMTGPCTANEVQDQAYILLEDSGASWKYAEEDHELEEKCVQDEKRDLLTSLQELQSSAALVASLERQLQEECAARRLAEKQGLQYKQQISDLAAFSLVELQQLQSSRVSIIADVMSMVDEGKKWIQSLSESWKHLLNDARVSRAEPVDIFEERNLQLINEKDKFKDIEEHINNEEAGCSDLSPKGLYIGNMVKQIDNDVSCDDNRSVPAVEAVIEKASLSDDSKEALAQALTEKVSALLLLSQQEERHLLEKNVTLALESQIMELKQRLRQVTNEKVNALMELAQLRECFMELQDQERDLSQALQQKDVSNASAQPLPTIRDGNENNSERKRHSKGYLRSWLRGFELPISKSKAISQSLVRSTTYKKSDESFSVARLRVENAGLKECLSSIQHLTKSANRLRLTIMGVAAESSSQNEYAIQKAIDVINNAIAEVHHLRIAFGSSLPVSYCGGAGIDSPTQRESVILPEEADVHVMETPDVASAFGVEIVELLKMVAELQKASLIQELNAVKAL